MINTKEELPVHFKLLSDEVLNKLKGSLAGSSQPGYYWITTTSDSKILSNLQNGMNVDNAGVDPWMIEEFEALNQKGIDVIYSLACANSERDPALLKWIWKHKFHKTLVTEIDGVSISIQDYNAPSVQQMELISNDVLKRLNKGENVLITCGAGIGRTGTMLAATLMKLTKFYETKQIVLYLRNIYSVNAVEGKVQYQALEDFANFNKNKINQKEYEINSLKVVNDLAIKNLDEDINSYAIDYNDKQALIKAVRRGDPASIKLILENKFDINQIIDDTSALLEAAKIGKPSIIKLLIEHGANIDICDSSGQTPVIKTALSQTKPSLKSIHILIQNNADISIIDNNGHDVLYYLNNSTDKLSDYKKELLMKS